MTRSMHSGATAAIGRVQQRLKRVDARAQPWAIPATDSRTPRRRHQRSASGLRSCSSFSSRCCCSGRCSARPVGTPETDSPSRDSHLFQLEIYEAVLVGLNADRNRLVIGLWRSEAGSSRRPDRAPPRRQLVAVATHDPANKRAATSGTGGGFRDPTKELAP